jgi:hypothetical protein
MAHGRKSGQRRAYLKRFSSTVVGGSSGIDKHYFREAAQRAHAMSHKDIAFMKLFGLDDPTKANDRARQQRGEREPFLVETPRDRVLKQLDDCTQGCSPELNICLVPKQVYMFWSQSYYYLVKFDMRTIQIKRSFRYSDREQLMFAFQNNCVRWKD